MYKLFKGSKPYLVESTLFELLASTDEDEMNPRAYVNYVNFLLARWAGISENGDFASSSDDGLTEPLALGMSDGS